MAEIKVTIPNAKLTKVVDALCHNGDYTAKVYNETNTELIDNPVSKQEFARKQIIAFIKENVRRYNQYKAQEADTEDLNLT